VGYDFLNLAWNLIDMKADLLAREVKEKFLGKKGGETPAKGTTALRGA